MLGLLALEAFLLLSAWFRWFPLNQHNGWTVLICLATVGAALLLMFLWFLAALVFRLRFQYGILSLLVLVVAVALPFAWLKTEMNKATKQREAVEEITKVAGEVYYDYQYDPSNTTGQPTEPAWLRGLLGNDLFANVTVVVLDHSEISDAGLEHLKGLTQLQELRLDYTRVTDAGVQNLKGLTRLQELHLDGTEVSDKDVGKLHQALPNCTILD